MSNFKLIINGEETVVNTTSYYTEYIMACDILIAKLQQKRAEFEYELKRQALSQYREEQLDEIPEVPNPIDILILKAKRKFDELQNQSQPRLADDDIFGVTAVPRSEPIHPLDPLYDHNDEEDKRIQEIIKLEEEEDKEFLRDLYDTNPTDPDIH